MAAHGPSTQALGGESAAHEGFAAHEEDAAADPHGPAPQGRFAWAITGSGHLLV